MAITEVNYFSSGSSGSEFSGFTVELCHTSTNGTALTLKAYINGTQEGSTVNITGSSYGRVFDGNITATVGGKSVNVRAYATNGSQSKSPIYFDISVNGTLKSTISCQVGGLDLDLAYTHTIGVLYE